jgi:hypothetical protein
MPLLQSTDGQALEPSAHSRQGAPGWGHGFASLHCVPGDGVDDGAGGHDGQVTPHTPSSQVAVGQALEPSAHRRHAAPSGAAQSPALWHSGAGHTGAVSEHRPLVHHTV